MKNLFFTIVLTIIFSSCKKEAIEINLVGSWELNKIKAFNSNGYFIEETEIQNNEYLQFNTEGKFHHVILNEQNIPLQSNFDLVYQYINKVLKVPANQLLYNHTSLPVEFISDNSLKLFIHEANGAYQEKHFNRINIELENYKK